MNTMKTILIVDDSPELRKVLALYVKNAGYHSIEAENGLEALEVWSKEKIDLALVDVMMPKMDGLTLIQKIRETSEIPILVLSARDQVTDKISGLSIGADDYVSKPFDPMEIIARINALLRRVKPAEKMLVLVPLRWDNDLKRVFLNDESLALTGKEYDILTLLIRHPRRIFSKEEIYAFVWKEDYFSDDNTIMVHLSNLREKLGPYGEMIKTVRGLGYSIEA